MVLGNDAVLEPDDDQRTERDLRDHVQRDQQRQERPFERLRPGEHQREQHADHQRQEVAAEDLGGGDRDVAPPVVVRRRTARRSVSPGDGITNFGTSPRRTNRYQQRPVQMREDARASSARRLSRGATRCHGAMHRVHCVSDSQRCEVGARRSRRRTGRRARGRRGRSPPPARATSALGRIEAPDAFQQSLAAQHLVTAGDARRRSRGRRRRTRCCSR